MRNLTPRDPSYMGALSVTPPPLGLSLRFADNKSLNDAVSGQNLITYSRTGSGTFVDASGVLRTEIADQPRFTHDPLTLQSLGLMVEEQRTNLLLNSGTLATQSVTVSATPYTLTFTGTGTVTLSGTSTAGPLVGTGVGEANRVRLTFTPTAGTLTLTVAGTVINAQLEAGPFPTSYIPTAGSAATRGADLVTIAGSNFSSWYNQTEGTIFTEASVSGIPSSGVDYRRIVAASGSNVNTDEISIYRRSLDGFIGGAIATSGTPSFDEGFSSSPINTVFKAAIAYKTNDTACGFNGRASATDTTVTLPTATSLQIGQAIRYQAMPNAIFRRIDYWPQRLPNTMLQAITL